MITVDSTDFKLLSALHDGQGASSTSTVVQIPPQDSDSIRLIIVVLTTITFLHFAIIAAFRRFSKQMNFKTNQKMMKVSYQATNLCVNLFLGLYGIYHYSTTLPVMSTVPVTHRVTGFEQYTIFAVLQIGYNMWSLPVGYFIVGEETAMLIHHIAALCVSLVSCFGANGFRYHAVFFYGVIEISSVPLSIMNYCKENPEWAEKHIPTLATLVRPVFAITFLVIRVVLFTLNIYDVLRSCGMMFWSSPTLLGQICYGLFFISAVFLTALQYHWGLLVVKGIARAILGAPPAAKKVD